MKNETLHLCLLPEPEQGNIAQKMVYNLFMAVGIQDPPEMKNKYGGIKRHEGRSAYNTAVIAEGRFGFLYTPGFCPPEPVKKMAIPEWAIEYAFYLFQMGNIAYEKGYYEGEQAGYSCGRQMLVMLAKCEVTVDEFENYDPQKDRKRPLRQIWDQKARKVF